jgi:hypothetical protein
MASMNNGQAVFRSTKSAKHCSVVVSSVPVAEQLPLQVAVLLCHCCSLTPFVATVMAAMFLVCLVSPGVLDPITLEPVVNPAISPAGHVMGLATWKAVLAENPRCPFTKASLRPDMLTVLTKHNIERHRHRIIAAK